MDLDFDKTVTLLLNYGFTQIVYKGHGFTFHTFKDGKLYGESSWGKPCAWDGKNFFFLSCYKKRELNDH